MSNLLSAEQVAEWLGVSARYVWRLGREGELPRIELGRYVRFDPDDVAAFIEQRKQRPRQPRARQRERSAPSPRRF